MVPKLRFNGFTIPWKKSQIASILTIGSGRDYKHLAQGEVPVFGTGGLMTYVDAFLHNGETVCIGRKGTIDKPFYYSGKIWTVDTLFFTHSFIKVLPKFVFNLFCNINWKEHNEATGVPSLSKNIIGKIEVFYPDLKEQTKIANFLASVDEKVTLLNKQHNLLCQYKKGMMQKIFNQELKFKDDNGKPFPKWNSLQLKDVAIRVTRKNKENNNTILTISGRDGLVDQMTYFNKQIASKDVTGYYLIRKSEFAYNKSYSQGYPMGAIKMLSNYEKGIVSTLYICFKLNDEQSCDFYQHYFESGLQNRAIEKIAQEGARNHGLLNIGVNDFFDIELQVPSLAEQNKIAHFLSAIEDKIAIKRAELDMLKNWKQGLLQQMFV